MSADHFLSRIARDVKFADEPEKPSKVITEIKSNNDDIVFDTSDLYGQKSPSILEQINPTLTEEDVSFFKNLDKSTTNANSIDEKAIRKLMREELEKFFKEKTVLHESANTEIIYFKIGNTLFKGTLEPVQ